MYSAVRILAELLNAFGGGGFFGEGLVEGPEGFDLATGGFDAEATVAEGEAFMFKIEREDFGVEGFVVEEIVGL